MTPIEGQPILTAAAMRAAEERAIAAGSSVDNLMERAGAGVADAVRRLAAGAPVLVLCGPGNNGGDGYVAARILAAHGIAIRVAALGEPRTEAATRARQGWSGAVEDFQEVSHAEIVVDGVFGTGSTRPLDACVEERWVDLMSYPRLSFAIDLPSGLNSDLGDMTPRPFAVDITLALGALKPAHVLYPAAAHCGTVRLIDIGLAPFVGQADQTIARPWVAAPRASDHKYTRGLVIVIGGEMPGAAALAALAAMRAGAGYTILFEGGRWDALPHALVRRAWSATEFARAIDGKRKASSAVVIGPGLGRDKAAKAKLAAVVDSPFPLVIDGDALHLLDDTHFDRFKARHAGADVVLTPHAGEFLAVFGAFDGNKIEAARAAAVRSGATIVLKGADTVVAHPNGTASVAVAASPWLSTAGTGDVLAGTIAAMLAAQSYDPAAAAVWMHGEAARRLGASFIADDLARELSAVRATL